MEDVLVGAFKLYVATGAMESRASIYNTPQGLGIAVPALLEVLRRRYPGETVRAAAGGCTRTRGRACPSCMPCLPLSAEGAWSRCARAVPGCQAGTSPP